MLPCIKKESGCVRRLLYFFNLCPYTYVLFTGHPLLKYGQWLMFFVLRLTLNNVSMDPLTDWIIVVMAGNKPPKSIWLSRTI